MRMQRSRTLALLLALVLCITGLTTSALAEENDTDKKDEVVAQSVENTPEVEEKASETKTPETKTPEVWYRIHAIDTTPWESDTEGWRSTKADKQEYKDRAAAKGIDSLELIYSDDASDGGVEYRIANKEGVLGTTWFADGAAASDGNGIYGIEARLTGEVAENYELWYRSRTTTSGWLSWAHQSVKSGSSIEPIVEVEFAVLPLGEQPVDDIEGLVAYEGDAPKEADEKTKDGEPETGRGDDDTASLEAMAGVPTVEYQAHCETYGWLDWVNEGETAGTTGQFKRMEAVCIRLKNANGSIHYTAHTQTYGWLGDITDGDVSGTTGQFKRMEAIKIYLTGEISKTYDVWYRMHVQTYGWLDWVCNGDVAGTTGEFKRAEALEVRLVKKNDAPPAGASAPATAAPATPSVRYAAHTQTYGWLDEVADGQTGGTTGEFKRMEAVRAYLQNANGGIEYRAHTQTYGWLDWVSDNAVAGTTGEFKRMEAIQMHLTGAVADEYDLWYRCHVEHYGWLDWACNDEMAGTTGYSYRAEAIEIKLLPRGSSAPGATDTAFLAKTNTVPSSTPSTSNKLNGVDISGWDQGIDIYDTEGDFFIIKATEGVSSPGKPATRYNPWYTQWADEVLDSGRLLGFYHYANGGDAIQEADDFYEAIKDYQGRAIACLDWEGDGNKTFNTGMDVQWCKTFLDRLQSRFGGTPFIYTSKNYCNAYNWSSVAASYPLWGAQYPDSDPMRGYQSNPWQSSNGWGAWGAYPTIFQYTGTGVLTRNGGIDYFDFDLFYGSRDDWAMYL